MTKSEKHEAETQLWEARTIVNFLKKHMGLEDLKILIRYGNCSDDDWEGLPDDTDVITKSRDSVEIVRKYSRTIRLNYFGTLINALMMQDGSVWFDPFDFQQFRDLEKDRLARRKLHELERDSHFPMKYAVILDGGRRLFSFDGLRTLTDDDGWEDNRFCSWFESILFFIDKGGDSLTFSIG